MDDSLRYSHSQADASWWDEVYRTAFPDMVTTVDLRHDGWHQKAGRDRAIVLSSGRVLYVDEKVRRNAYRDVALEIWSVYPKGSTAPYPPRDGAVPGWARKPLDCDFLAYAFVPTWTCYLLPFFTLRTLVARHERMFYGKATLNEDGYRWVVAHNDRYDTVSVAVPLSHLTALMTDAMTVAWRAAA